MESGSKLVLFYSDDDVWHERYVLLPGSSEGLYWICTPDDDIYGENLSSNGDDGPSKVKPVPRCKSAISGDRFKG